MEAFLTVVFVFVLVGWLLSRFGPPLLARWLRRRMERFSSHGEQIYDTYGQRGAAEGTEGDTVVSVKEEKEKIVGRNVGEYVEFTESEEKKEK
ncbi:MAG: hypothetical protein PHP30_01310 [Bacteroidales bacterium]|nr:hypothetical protein [Bacteroidales bacterium]MDD2424601.1 hypothetical protein [Bacteroidales bacterium]MDD3988725.1 hypothetical protein [Bacteroidales bacterium]MDD4638572.1 hypothetical protein [Bacteroidales bacterium]